MSATALYVGVNGVAQKVFDSSDFGNLFDSAIDENNLLYHGQAISNFRQVTSYTAIEDCYAFVVYEGSGGTNQFPVINGKNMLGFDALSGNRASTIIPLKKGDVISSRYYDANESCYFKITVYGRKPAAVSHDYSLDEQPVGTWVDGKTLYEKTFYANSGWTANAWSPIADVSDLHVETLVKLNGRFSRGELSDLQYTFDSSTRPERTDTTSMVSARIFVGNLELLVNNLSSVSHVYITIQYTKSTD